MWVEPKPTILSLYDAIDAKKASNKKARTLDPENSNEASMREKDGSSGASDLGTLDQANKAHKNEPPVNFRYVC